MSSCVIKIGGSILHRQDGIELFRRWWASRPESTGFLVVGGGLVVDAVRELDQIHDLDPDLLHWCCIDLLDTTFAIASALLPEAIPIHQLDDWPSLPTNVPLSDRDSSSPDRSTFLTDSGSLPTGTNKCLHIVRVGGFYQRPDATGLFELEQLSRSIPIGWETTSDTLAYLLMRRLGLNHLILLKSCEIPAPLDLASLSKQGIVDEAFPSFLREGDRIEVIELKSSHLL